MTTQDKIQIMQAFVEGKIIETKDKSIAGALYITMGNKKEPLWNWESFDYRIKPEPMEIQVWCNDNGTPVALKSNCPTESRYTLKTFVEKGDA